MAKAKLFAALLFSLVCLSRLHAIVAQIDTVDAEPLVESTVSRPRYEDHEHDFERCGAEDVDDDHYHRDPTFGGRCNGHHEDEDDYWTKTPKYTRKYNDDVYSRCSKRVCRAPRYQGCCDDPTSARGVQGIFVIPPPITKASATAPYLAASRVSAMACSSLATQNHAYFWQHHVPCG